MTQLKTVIRPDGREARSDELTFTAKGRAAKIMARLERGRHRGRACPPRQLLTVAYPNRATEIAPLISGNCTRWTRNSTSREVDAPIGVSHGGHVTATGARSSASSSAVRVTAAS